MSITLFEKVQRTELDSYNIRLETNQNVTVFIAESGWVRGIYTLTHTNPEGGRIVCRTGVLDGELFTIGNRPGERSTLRVVKVDGKTYLDEDISRLVGV
jgi:hypothetical protein